MADSGEEQLRERFVDWSSETVSFAPKWNLDDAQGYARVARFLIPHAWSWADMREGRRDVDKREQIRAAAAQAIPTDRSGAGPWAFRIWVRKAGWRPFDIENVPKLIVDAFSASRIRADGSSHAHLGLYVDDTIDHVVMVQVGGERTTGADETEVEIFVRRGQSPSSVGTTG